MRADFYIVIQGKKLRSWQKTPSLGSVRTTKTKPHTKADEIALRLTMEIPDALFDKPTLEANITVPEDGQRGSVITAEVQKNIAEIIRERTGLIVHVRVPEEPSEASENEH